MYFCLQNTCPKESYHDLELHGTWGRPEAVERGSRVLEIEDFGIFVIRGVHRLQFRIIFEHVDLGFTAVIADEGAGDTQPLGASLVHGADFDLAVFLDLLGAVLGLARLDVEFALEYFDGAERAHTRLVTVDRREEICTAFLDKILDFFHNGLLDETRYKYIKKWLGSRLPSHPPSTAKGDPSFLYMRLGYGLWARRVAPLRYGVIAVTELLLTSWRARSAI